MNPTTLDFLLSLQFWCKQCWFLNFGPVWLTSLHFILMKVDFISLKLDHTICMIYSTCNNARLILLTTFASLFIFMELIRSCTKNGLPSRDWNPRLYYGFSSVYKMYITTKKATLQLFGLTTSQGLKSL